MLRSILYSPSRRFVLVCIFILFVIGLSSYVHEVNLYGAVHNVEYKSINGVVDREVVTKDYSQEIVLRNGEDRIILVRTSRYPEYRYGDVLSIKCELTHPDNLNREDSEFNYGRYLRMQGMDFVCNDAEIVLVKHNKRYTLRAFIILMRKKVGNVVKEIWPEPHTSFIAGVLYGARAEMPQDLKNKFSETGLTHIMAVSGYNVTIIANIVMALLRGVGVRRKQSFAYVFIGVSLFVMFVGASASAVRAGIMGIVALLGRTLGRGSSAGPILVFSALLMAIHNPWVLLYDVGFHLSMLATIGLIYLSPIIENKLKWITEFLGLREIIATSISAIIFTAPIISYVFGKFSLVSLVANIIVLPVIPLLMICSAIAVSIGFIWLQLGVVFGSVAWLISKYVLGVVELFSKLPWVSMPVGLSLVGAILSYLIICVWIYVQRKKLLLP